MNMLESELCDTLALAAHRHGWTVYPETCKWDLLVVKQDIQIGVQAKVRANMTVIEQALPRWRDNRVHGPRYRSILVCNPYLDCLRVICEPLKVWVFGPQETRIFQGEVTEIGYGSGILDHPERMDAYVWTGQPHPLPPVVPSGSGGVPCPSPLSKWKLGALRLLARATVRPVTSQDAKDCGVTLQLFQQKQWLREDGKSGRRKAYVLGEAVGRPDIRHPQEFAWACGVEATTAQDHTPGKGECP